MSSKIAVVVSGWHFPLDFYEQLVAQAVPPGWQIDFFCIAHRDPKYAKPEVKTYLAKLREGQRADLDRRLYKKVATKADLKKLGWKYILKPNTIGDWGNTNQWLEDYDYKEYDAFLFSHDDNLIINPATIYSVLSFPEKWDIVTNSVGMPAGSIRGSFEFFKKSVLDLLGGKFDLSMTTLTREGETSNPTDKNVLLNWNNTVYPLAKTVQENNLVVLSLSPCYRVSMFCIEGERGFISNTHGENTKHEEEGLATLTHHKLL